MLSVLEEDKLTDECELPEDMKRAVEMVFREELKRGGEREAMTKLFMFFGMFLGGWIGWWVGSHIGFWTAYLLSSAGSIMGVYLGWRIAPNLVD